MCLTPLNYRVAEYFLFSRSLSRKLLRRVRNTVGATLINTDTRKSSQPGRRCCGSGSRSEGSVCFWASQIPMYGYGSRSFHHQAKIVRKTLISTVFSLLYDFIPVFQIRIRMFLGLPDPYQNCHESTTLLAAKE